MTCDHVVAKFHMVIRLAWNWRNMKNLMTINYIK